MIINKKIVLLSMFPMALSIASCTQLTSLLNKSTASQVQRPGNTPARGVTYPASRMIYNVCHERWLRNGYSNYTFNIEEGTYIPEREVQRGRFTQTVVANHRVSQAATCEISYHSRGASCDQNTRKRLTSGRTIDSFFALWEKNPDLYQSCHPVLGYPTGYGHTYGEGNRRIDSSKWLIISSVIPRRSSQVALGGQGRRGDVAAGAQHPAQRTSSDTHRKQRGQKHASVTDVEVKLLSSHVEKSRQRSTLISRFDVINPTGLPALLGIKGWIIDKNYQRYPLIIDGGQVKPGQTSQVYTLEVEPHTQVTVSYKADGVPDISVGKRTAAMLEIMSVDGAKVNLTLPNQ